MKYSYYCTVKITGEQIEQKYIEDPTDSTYTAPYYEWLDCYETTGEDCGDKYSMNYICYTTSYCEGVDFGDDEVVHWMNQSAISLACNAIALFATLLFV